MKILVAVDGSDISLRALKFAINLSRRFKDGAKLVLTAVDPPLFPGVEKKIGKANAEQHHADNHAYMLKRSRATLARAKAEYREELAIGEIAETILDVAGKVKPDLIVLGSHGRTPVKGVLLGSVSAKVIAQTQIPVTIVR